MDDLEPSKTRRVALRKESVDRNQVAVHFVTLSAVALRKESVDRNQLPTPEPPRVIRSLSARRAWIEIPKPTKEKHTMKVALRKESVDRNSCWVLA